MPARCFAVALPVPCRCHSGRHVALRCQRPANARPSSCRYLAAAMTMHGQCTANARPVHGRCNAATKPDRHSAAMPVPCQCTASTSLAPCPCTAAMYSSYLHYKATLPALGRCSANARPLLCQVCGRHLAGTSPVYLAGTWLVLDRPPGRY